MIEATLVVFRKPGSFVWKGVVAPQPATDSELPGATAAAPSAGVATWMAGEGVAVARPKTATSWRAVRL